MSEMNGVWALLYFKQNKVVGVGEVTMAESWCSSLSTFVSV